MKKDKSELNDWVRINSMTDEEIDTSDARKENCGHPERGRGRGFRGPSVRDGKKRMTIARFTKLLTIFQLPPPRIVHQI